MTQKAKPGPKDLGLDRQMTVRLPSDVAERLLKVAQSERRSMNAVVLSALSTYIEKAEVSDAESR